MQQERKVVKDLSSNKKKFFTKIRMKKILIIKVIILFIIFSLFYTLKIAKHYPKNIDLVAKENYFGITFSTKYCSDMGLNYKEVYQEILSDLGVKKIRIPVYWDEIEKEEGIFDFSRYDYLIDEGEKYGVDFIISFGHRVPRWPECHTPLWYNKKKESQKQKSLLNLTEKVVKHYQDRESVEFWQVENEPFLGTFGVCPPLDKELLEKQFSLVRELDDRQIIITSSGELRFWNQEAKIGDIFGSTLYRVVHNNWFGFIRYPLPTSFYKIKGKLAGLDNSRLMTMELQLEPWVPQGPITSLNQAEIDKSMSIDQFKANLQYAINLDFSKAYTWGVEWWYFQKKFGNPKYWSIAKDIFSQSNQ